ncbi:MAG: glutamyl-tRNA reductase [Rhodothermales bacterium]|nr:glutamyl-tRNA reductase [Rhodothermales bacterium]
MIESTDVFCLGMNHRTAPVDVRERLALTRGQQQTLLAHCRKSDVIKGFVLLSTCNRVEFYASLEEPWSADGANRLKLVLAEADVDITPFEDHLYVHRGIDAAWHLSRVAAGLDALVLGESEILGQIDRAVKLADDLGTLDAHLETLFQFALKAGRRARTETGINHNPVSVSSVAVKMAEKEAGRLDSLDVAVVGLGETGHTAVKILRKAGVNRLTLVNRTWETAEKQAREIGADVASVSDLQRVLEEVAVVISATGCPYPLITRDLVEDAVTAREGRPLYLLDLAVPHDVAPEAGDIDGVRLIDVDMLRDEVSASLAGRKAAIPDVEAILADEVGRFGVWFQQSRVQPLISELRRQAESIRRQEIDRFSKDHPELSGEVRSEVERFSQALVQKLFHHPTTRIREEATDGNPANLAEAVRSLFRLQDQ